jgi:hypothetical protein
LEKIPSFHNFLFIDLLPFEFTNLSLLRMRKALGIRPSHTHKNPQLGLAKFDAYSNPINTQARGHV